MAVDVDPRQKRNRTRSPAYPYIPLPAALEKAAVLWQVEGRHAAAVNVAMQHWGYKEESSTGYSCVAALKKFGLVDHEGMGDNRQVRLSGLALSILLDKNPDSPERRDALRSAALGPRIHAELWERYGTGAAQRPVAAAFSGGGTLVQRDGGRRTARRVQGDDGVRGDCRWARGQGTGLRCVRRRRRPWRPPRCRPRRWPRPCGPARRRW